MKLTDADRTQVVNALKRGLNARPGWDLDPEWGHIYRTDTGRMRLQPIPVPGDMWARYGHPKNLLGAYRQLLAGPSNPEQRGAAAGIRSRVPENMVGMYLLHEGWAPPAHKVQALLQAERRGARTQRYKDMPDRVEVRQAGAVDLDSSMYVASQPRPTMVLHGIVDTVGDSNTEVAGRLPELLYSIMMLMLQPA